ncbi:refilin-B [Echinops telfairi]|uniref:Refilin-B n=1 Tax=Echinops telfairi TaxID=9371 RepID=A0ABM1VMT9_ECHTE|nr:refilin-B [Echinops telfairi]
MATGNELTLPRKEEETGPRCRGGHSPPDSPANDGWSRQMRKKCTREGFAMVFQRLRGTWIPASLPTPLATGCSARLCPLSFGEGVEFDPLPPTEVRYTSSVKYDSERHFIDDVHMPLGLAVASCSQTVICVPNCTWRNYRAEVRFEPRHRPARFLSTTIVYPKYPKTVYTTTLDYNCRKTLRRFLSSVELEATEFLGSDCLSDEC